MHTLGLNESLISIPDKRLITCFGHNAQVTKISLDTRSATQHNTNSSHFLPFTVTATSPPGFTQLWATTPKRLRLQAKHLLRE